MHIAGFLGLDVAAAPSAAACTSKGVRCVCVSICLGGCLFASLRASPVAGKRKERDIRRSIVFCTDTDSLRTYILLHFALLTMRTIAHVVRMFLYDTGPKTGSRS